MALHICLFKKESFSKAIEPFGDCLEKFKAKNCKQKSNFDVQSSFFASYDYSTATMNFNNEQKAKEFLIFAKNHIIDTSELVLLEKSHFVWSNFCLNKIRAQNERFQE